MTDPSHFLFDFRVDFEILFLANRTTERRRTWTILSLLKWASVHDRPWDDADSQMSRVEALVEAALSIGINHFWIWRRSMAWPSVRSCWVRFSSVVRIFRDQMWIQSKWDLQRRLYPFWFFQGLHFDSVDDILERLQIERLDSLPSSTGCSPWSLKRWRQLWSVGASGQGPSFWGCLIKILRW